MNSPPEIRAHRLAKPRAVPWLHGLCASLLIFASRGAHGQVVDSAVQAGVFYEPSASSDLVVLTPSAALGVNVSESLRLNLGYEADIVSGATESVKAGPLPGVDVISSATRFSDVRQVVSGGFAILRDETRLSASYSRGAESDYRSHALTVAAATTFLQRNTELELSYGRGFDQVCTSAYAPTLSPSVRSRLDSSRGCFTSADNRSSRDIDLDTVQLGWTQTWTPVLASQVVFTGGLQHGFLGNPYREVVIGPAGDRALENHPDNRARAAVALRLKYFVRSLDMAIGGGVRGYRDTWDVLSATFELDAERHMLPWLRMLLRARFYDQTGALFWSNDYTGGEPELGPRGQYWTGDRELSPLRSYLLGSRLLASARASGDKRLVGLLERVSASAGADVLKTDLREFSWGGKRPDDTIALMLTLSLAGAF